MSIIAAFHWQKHPRHAISMLIFNDETMEILSPPKIFYFSGKLFSFRSDARKMVTAFTHEVYDQYNLLHLPVVIEFRILLQSQHTYYIRPSGETKYVAKIFKQAMNTVKDMIPNMKIKPQLRNRLSGRHLIKFKRSLRTLKLVSRKRDTGYEYFLWAIGLHATPKTYEGTLKRVDEKLKALFWSEFNA